MTGSRLYILMIALLFSAANAVAQSEATQLADKEFRQADALLNRAYQQLQLRLESARARDELAKAQRAWIGFRDSDSAFHAGVSSGGGSAYSTDYLANRTQLTEQRTAQLNALLRSLK
jgi:uncharacterized protein YecT (DUF1311 family)